MIATAKQLIRNILYRSGYELHKVGAPSSATPINVFLLVVQDLMQRTKAEDFFFVQIGAHDGLHYDPIRPFIKKYHWRGILIEPQPKIFKRLVKNYEDEPQLIFENAAIFPEDGQTILYAFKETANLPDHASMLATFNRESLLCNGHGYKGEIEELPVKALSLKSLLAQYRVQKIDLLQIDTEGYDFNIIKMFEHCKIKPAIIHFESGFLTKGQMNQCCELFGKWGYRAITIGIDTLAYRQPDDSNFAETMKNKGYDEGNLL